MPKTKTYKFERFERGNDYNAKGERRRFVTLDNNLESYIGIVGIGVIDGWDIEALTGLSAQINPGTGMIDGYYMESSYTVKTRSEMVDGDREIDVITGEVPATTLTSEQRTEYVRVVRLYNPTFDPIGDITNEDVKVSVPYSISFSDNSDTYVYVRRLPTSTPYPLLTDHPPAVGDFPLRQNFDSGSEYLYELGAWNTRHQTALDYKWYESVANHFTTTIEFVKRTTITKDTTYVLLGKVITRNGVISEIDGAGVRRLKDLESPITEAAAELINSHIHGGSKYYDPPHIRLETDRRSMFLANYDYDLDEAIFMIPEKDFTSIARGHRHTYFLNANNNGYTVAMTGDGTYHYHKIRSLVMSNPDNVNITDHTHDILRAGQKGDTLSSSSPYVIKYDDYVVGGSSVTNNNIIVDFTNKIVSVKNPSLAKNTYKTSMTIDGSLFEFEYSTTSVMDYVEKLKDNMDETYGAESGLNPFYNSDPDDLEFQSVIAHNILTSENDTFTLIPSAANYVDIVLYDKKQMSDYEFEVLINTEVQGVLPQDNIMFIRADKIVGGELLPTVIPFISHIGRYFETFLPTQYTLFSNDGFRYDTIPLKTTEALGHSHILRLNSTGDGYTSYVTVDDQPVMYGIVDGERYCIGHSHMSNDFVLANASQNNLLTWQEADNGFSGTSSSHTHEVIYPSVGNPMVVYSIKEDYLGNTYAGTSDGLIFMSSEPSYLYAINEYEVNVSGDGSLYSLLVEAKEIYEKETGNSFIVTEEIYGSQLESAGLSSVGDEIVVLGEQDPLKERDKVLIRRVSYYKVPEFDYLTPVWSLYINNPLISNYERTKNIFAIGSDLIAKQEDTSSSWDSIKIPYEPTVLRKIIKTADGQYWINTDNGVLVSRSWNYGDLFEVKDIDNESVNIFDILETNTNEVCIASYDGVLKTIDGGKTWSNVLSTTSGFYKILRDITLDKSNVVNSHYHETDINDSGSGFLLEANGHVHSVSGWSIGVTNGHAHSLVTTIYAFENSGNVFKSIDSGSTWSEFKELPSGEIGSAIAVFDRIYIAKTDGIYVWSDAWYKIFEKAVFSMEWNYDRDKILIGTDGVIYETEDMQTFTTNHTLGGSPAPSVIESESKQYFGYAYNNLSRIFHFSEKQNLNNQIFGMVEFDKVYGNGGTWEDSTPIDVYIDDFRVYSAKFDDDKRATLGYRFEPLPDEGALYFGVVTNTSSVSTPYTNLIDVNNSSSFYVGDSISLKDKDTDAIQYFSIESISDNTITLNNRIVTDANTGSEVKRVPNVDGVTDIDVTIYDGILSNIGTLTHDQIEDSLSIYDGGQPNKINDVFISNITLLTQGARYVYPSIAQYFNNHLYYDFRYSTSASDPVYPYLDSKIDMTTTKTNWSSEFNVDFFSEMAGNVNSIFVGTGSFVGYLFAATNIGLFWSKVVDNFESNWKYVNELSFAVNDVISVGDTVYAATDNGIYSSTNLVDWISVGSPVDFRAISLALRWSGEYLTVDSHRAYFDINAGIIYAVDSGTPYVNLLKNRAIKINIGDGLYGIYFVTDIGDGGYGYGSKLTLSSNLSGGTGIKDDVTMTMATWWQDISDVSTKQALVDGGLDSVAYMNIGESWSQSSVLENETEVIPNFSVKDLKSFSDGRMLAISDTSTDKYVLSSLNNATSFKSAKKLPRITGTVTSSSVTDANNSQFVVNITSPSNYVIQEGFLNGSIIAFFSSGTFICNGDVVWNYKYENQDLIVISGSSSDSLVAQGDTFDVEFWDLNCVTEYEHTPSQNEDLYGKGAIFGTSFGLRHDDKTLISENYLTGNVLQSSHKASVSAVDLSGKIKTISYDSENEQTTMTLTADQNVRKNKLIDYLFYVVDLEEVEAYTAISNESIVPSSEFSIIVSGQIPQSYLNKKYTVVGENSRIYVDFEAYVINNQFSDGKIYVLSDEYNNKGKSYNISGNTRSYIDLDGIVTPPSTLNPSSSDSLRTGQIVSVIDADGNIFFGCTFDRTVLDDEINSLTMEIYESNSSSLIGELLSITSNTGNTITAKYNGNLNIADLIDFVEDSKFRVEGLKLKDFSSFNYEKTSTDLGHYHSSNLVGTIVSGEIGSFSDNNNSYADINVTNTVNFSNPIVQEEEDLFEDAIVTFVNKSTFSEHRVRMISNDATSIRVRIEDTTIWDFTGNNDDKISVGWDWYINAQNYGYTTGITYDDFVSYSSKLTQDLGREDTTVYVQDVSGFNNGDRVRIIDSTNSEQETVISSVGSNNIVISDGANKTYFVNQNSQIKVLTNSFSNTHTHQIRRNEVLAVDVQAYSNLGYNYSHSHKVIPLISNISDVLETNHGIVVIGDSSVIYNSTDYGSSWHSIGDMNDHVENSKAISKLSTVTELNSEHIAVGSSGGDIFVNDVDGSTIVRLDI